MLHSCQKNKLCSLLGDVRKTRAVADILSIWHLRGQGKGKEPFLTDQFLELPIKIWMTTPKNTSSKAQRNDVTTC